MEKEQTHKPPVMPAQRQQVNEIDLIELLYVLWKHVIPIVLAAVIGGAAAFAYTHFRIKPTYVASAKIYVLSASSDSVVNLSDLSLGSSLATDYLELIKCRPLLEEVSDSLQLGIDASALKGMISVGNSTGNRVITISAVTTDPQLSADIANKVAEEACVFLPKIMSCEPPNIVETALVPTAKSSPNTTKNTLIGALLFAAIVAGIYIVRYLMDDTLSTADDVYKYLGIHPLASIPDAQSKGKRRKSGYGYGYGKGDNK